MDTYFYIYLLYFGGLAGFYFLMIYGGKVQTSYEKIKFPRLTSIRIGYIYAKKIDNHYYAKLIVKICKNHLNIKGISVSDVMADLYKSTKWGRLFF